MLIRDDLLQMIEALGGREWLTYVSVPITSGRRAFLRAEALGVRSLSDARAVDPETWLTTVQRPNEAEAAAYASQVRSRTSRGVVLNPAALTKVGWTDDDYNGLWIDVIEEFARCVVATPGWAWSRGGRLEVSAAIALGRPVERVDGTRITEEALEAEAQAARSELRSMGWSWEEVDRHLPPMVVQRSVLPMSPAASAFEWLIAERRYQLEKFGVDLDDRHTVEGVGVDSWWRDQLLSYLHRAYVLRLENPAGRQAAAKFTATACGLLESIIRVHGELPPPGVPSGELNGITGLRLR